MWSGICITYTGNSGHPVFTCTLQPPDSHYTDVKPSAGKTKHSSQDDRVKYSTVIPHTMEMQPEGATFDPNREPTPPLPLPDKSTYIV